MSNFPTEQHLDELSEDMFGRSDYAEKLLKNILLKTDLPNTIGIYGSWGSGKSTLVRYLKKKIDENEAVAKDVELIIFEPWKYEYAEGSDLVFALIKSIQRHFELSDGDVAELLASFVVGSSISIFSSLVEACTAGIIKPGEIGESAKKEFGKMRGVTRDAYENWVDSYNEISGLFDTFIQKGLLKNRKKKLFIVIDDLDRCSPESTVKILEAVKNFLSQENVLYILTVDRRIVSEMIEKKFGLSDGYGNEYLEKIISYGVTLPKPNIDDLVSGIFKKHNIVIEERVTKSVSHFINTFVPGEPRRVKRVLEQVIMNSHLSSSVKGVLDGSIEQLQFLIAAYFIVEKYPRYFSGDADKAMETLQLFYTLYRNQGSSNSELNRREEALKSLLSMFYQSDVDKIYSALMFQFLNNGRTGQVMAFQQEEFKKMLRLAIETA